MVYAGNATAACLRGMEPIAATAATHIPITGSKT
jgi:hypothetical protein